ncbi:MAG: IS30 family transposase [Nitratireductor sp.]|nr:IS30 family transposase [Nitratireductor sp.]
MGRHYKQLDLTERCRLVAMNEQGMTISGIARHLGRDRRTIQRELARNSYADGRYDPGSADRLAWVRRLRGSRIGRCSRLHETVTSSLAMGWTPQQISGRLQLEHGETVISHESIYRFIYSPAGRRLKLSRYLPHHHAKRGYRRRKSERKIPIPDRQGIESRPQSANDRSEPGHWEGDLVHFTRKCDILLTLTERKSRYWIMQSIPRRDSETVSQAIIDALAPFPKPLRKTITHDNGGEFARHKQVERQLGLPAYFCEPHSPWQRGAIENGNGRLRIDMPRKTKLSNYTGRDIQDLAMLYNNTPRKCLGYRTPAEVLQNEILNQGAALEM